MLNPDKNKRDLFVVGSGALGARVATLWRSQFPDAKVICETLTSRTHSSLVGIGCWPRLRSDALALTFPYVIAAIPPSKTLSYASEMQRAGAIWDGTGCLLGISSTGVYQEDEGGWVNEASPLAGSDRAQILVAGEEQIRSRGGAILRLAGLYSLDRGPHVAYRRKETSPLHGDGWINLIHYDDAATLATRILRERHPGTYLGCDNQPMQRREFAALLVAAEKTCRFTGTNGGLGKKCRNDWTRAMTHWEPRWKTFGDWLRSNDSSEVKSTLTLE